MVEPLFCLYRGKSYLFLGFCAHTGGSVAPVEPLRNNTMSSISPLFRRNAICRRRRAYRAYSLLEVVLASAICASALVPALAVMRDGVALGEIIDTRHLLLTYGVSKMEEQLAVVGATWATGTVTGNFASDGQSSIRFSVARSDAAASGGITNQLMNVSVTTYSDDNGNSTMDTSEARIVLTTKVAKSVSYATKVAS